MPSLKHTISLGITLYVFWWLLSGYPKPLLLGLGVVSTLLVLFLALRMEVLDHESHPVMLSNQLLVYWPWLAWAVLKANLQVARVVLARVPRFELTRVQVPTSRESAVAHVIFANSITLTPGTVALDVFERRIDALALTRAAALDLLSGDMERRVPDWKPTP